MSKILIQRLFAKLRFRIFLDIRPDEDTTLLQMLEYNLSDHIHRLEEVAGSAMKEFALERSLDKMKEEWEAMVFTLLPYRDTV